MRHFAFLGIFALAASAALPQQSQAQFFGGGNPFQYGGFCFCNFGKMHQHGPLYNYGPYYGYPPFQPYGPWTSDLRYEPGCSGGRCHSGLFNGWHLHWPHLGGCGHCGHYALDTFRNIFQRTHPCGHRVGCCGNGCNSCGGG
jgi:hypothetical protein